MNAASDYNLGGVFALPPPPPPPLPPPPVLPLPLPLPGYAGGLLAACLAPQLLKLYTSKSARCVPLTPGDKRRWRAQCQLPPTHSWPHALNLRPTACRTEPTSPLPTGCLQGPELPLPVPVHHRTGAQLCVPVSHQRTVFRLQGLQCGYRQLAAVWCCQRDGTPLPRPPPATPCLLILALRTHPVPCARSSHAPTAVQLL